MSDSYREGQDCARVSFKQFRIFVHESLPAILDDLHKIRTGRRKLRIQMKARIRFAVGIGCLLLDGTNGGLTRKDFADLAGLRVSEFNRMALRDPSINWAFVGKQKRTYMYRKGSTVGNPKTPGLLAGLYSFQVADRPLKMKMRNDKEFVMGFMEEWAVELNRYMEQYPGQVLKLRTMASELRGIDWKRIHEMVSAHIQTTESKIIDIRDRISIQWTGQDKERLIRNANRTIRLLQASRRELKALCNELSFENFLTDLIVDIVLLPPKEEKQLESIMNKLQLQMAFLALSYFVLPKTADEFAKYTRFYEAAAYNRDVDRSPQPRAPHGTLRKAHGD